jgi:hypothetical protein
VCHFCLPGYGYGSTDLIVSGSNPVPGSETLPVSAVVEGWSSWVDLNLCLGVGRAEAGIRLPREPAGRVHEEQDRREGEGDKFLTVEVLS